MGTLTIDAELKSEFDRRFDAYARRKTEEAGEGAHIIALPPMSGPSVDGRLTFVAVPSEFLEELKAEGFGTAV